MPLKTNHPSILLTTQGQDQLVLCDVFAALVRDVEKICDKQNYRKELDVLNGLNMTYGEYMRAEARLLAKLEIAKNLLDVLDHQTIANKTGLSLEQVVNL